MRRWFRRISIFAFALLAMLLFFTGVVYASTSHRLSRRWDVRPEHLPIPTDAASLARGKHTLEARGGCTDCHGKDLSGGMVIDSDAVGHIVAPNLTPAGPTRTFSDDDWVRAIRHGVAPDGRPLVVMPSYEFARLDRDDLAALIAYLKTVPPVEHADARMQIGPVGRALVFAGLVKVSAEVVDHDAPIPVAPPRGSTAAYGEYLVRAGCQGCHGENLAGGALPGAPSEWAVPANLTPAGELGGWTEHDFVQALRDGHRPDGSPIRAPMPIAATKLMADDELAAIWAYLRTVPPVEKKN